MAEWVLSSSILILLILLLRFLLRGRIDPRLQYALWLLVLLRLLLPVALFESPVSAAGLVEAAEERVAAYVPTAPLDRPASGNRVVSAMEPNRSGGVPALEAGDEAHSTPVPVKTKGSSLPTGPVLCGLWLLGTVVILLASLVSNRRFGRRLRGGARPLPGKWTVAPKKIYISAAPGAPCLFGLTAPAIYVPESIALDDMALGHVLSHERAHYRHGDQVWSALRVLVLALHWYNPLVWIACALSRRDAEAAADASAIAALGEKERTDYGLTLVGLVARASRPGDLLSVGTTMFGSRRTIKKRVKLIAKRPRTAAVTLLLAVLISAAAVGLTYAGPKREEIPVSSAALPALGSLPAGAGGPAPERVSLPSAWFLDEEAFLDFLSNKYYANQDYAGANYEQITQEEYQARYGYTLAQSEMLPERFKLYDKVIVHHFDADDELCRLWYDPISFEFLEIRQRLREGGINSSHDGAILFTDTDESGSGLHVSLGWAAYRAVVNFQAGDWSVSAVMYVNDPLLEFECKRILETITLEGVRPLDLNQYETVARSEGGLNTQGGGFDYDARLRRQQKTDVQGNPFWVYTCDVRFYRSPSGQYFQQLGFVPSSGESGPPALQADVADVNGDGSEDIVLSLSDGMGWRYVACYLYTDKRGAFIRADHFFGIADSFFDPETALFRVATSSDDGTFMSYDLYRIDGTVPALYRRLTVDKEKAEEAMYSEYSFSNGRVTALVENGPMGAVDTEIWAFALNKG